MLQYIAADAWIVTLLSNENKYKGSAARYVGMILGKFFSYNLFIPLSSTKFDNKYIFKTPHNVILNFSNFYLKV